MKPTKIENKLEEISRILVKQQVILEDHMKRTELLEDRVKPMETLWAEMKGAINFLKLLGIIVGIAEAVSMVVRHA
jgi:hypothetical protein